MLVARAFRAPRRDLQSFLVLLLFLSFLGPAPIAASAQAAKESPRILVYTRNYTPVGTEYVHENIADSVRAIQRIGAQHHFLVDATDDPSVFTDSNLARYAVLVFANTNNEALDTEPERAAFQHYIHAGHGLSACIPPPAPSATGLTSSRSSAPASHSIRNSKRLP